MRYFVSKTSIPGLKCFGSKRKQYYAYGDKEHNELSCMASLLCQLIDCITSLYRQRQIKDDVAPIFLKYT